jgi:hypothetical protein
METKKPEMVVCPKPCRETWCEHRLPHKRDELCNVPCCDAGEFENGCVPFSPSEPVKPDEGLLLTEVEMLTLFTQFIPHTLENERWWNIAKAQLTKLQPELDRREAEIAKRGQRIIELQERIDEIVDKKEARIKELEAELEVIDKNYRIKKGETWYWESNDENHLESLTCPVIINADDLRKLLAEAKAEAYKEIGEWLSEWRLKEHNISSVLLDLIAKLQKGEEVG